MTMHQEKMAFILVLFAGLLLIATFIEHFPSLANMLKVLYAKLY